MKTHDSNPASRCTEQRVVGHCEDCNGTGWYGDNGPGIVGNSEFCRCECGTGEKCKCGYHDYIEIGNVPWCQKCNREADMDICRIHAIPNAPADLPAIAGKVRRDVLRHNKLPGNFRVKEFPARDSLPDCALIEKEYSPGVWREYGIVGIDEFSPQNASVSISGDEPEYAPRTCSETLLACEGCWTHSIPVEALDGESCPLCGQTTMLFDQQEDFDPSVWSGGHNTIFSPNTEVEPRRGSDVGSNPLLGSCREIANNAIYFADNSDYRSALWEICSLLGMSDDDIGSEFMEPNAANQPCSEAE